MDLRTIMIKIPHRNLKCETKVAINQKLKIKKIPRNIVYSDVCPPPNIIRSAYCRDEIEKFDITYINDHVKAKLKYDSQNINHLELELEFYEEKLLSSKTIIDTKIISSKVSDLNTKIENIRMNFVNYTKETRSLIEKFKSEPSVDLLLNYVKIVKKYAEIEVVAMKQYNTDNCNFCGYDIENVHVNSEGVRTCPKCLGQDYSKSLLYKDTTPSANVVLNQSVSRCDKRNDDNIMKIFRYFACKQGAEEIPSSVFITLDKYFVENHNRNIGSWYKQFPPDRYGYTGDTNHEMLFEALKMTKLSAYFKYVNLIGQQYWGWSKPPISELEDEFRSIYSTLILAYEKIKDIERVSKPNNQFMLFNILRLLGCDFRLSQFKLPTTDKSRNENEYIYKRMCDLCCEDNKRICYIKTF
jgi:hypothetical protein